MEHRRFHRVKFAAHGELRHQGISYQIRLENISMKGALVSAQECIMIPDGDSCTLSLGLDTEELPAIMTVEIRHSFFSMVGVEFMAFELNAEERVRQLLQRIMDEQNLAEELWREVPAPTPPEVGEAPSPESQLL